MRRDGNENLGRGEFALFSKRLPLTISMQIQPWSFSFFRDQESDSEEEEEDAVSTKKQGTQVAAAPPDGIPQHQVSEDTRLARELDLSTRQETVEFRKTPWTIAASNAATRTRPISHMSSSRPSVTKAPQPKPDSIPFMLSSTHNRTKESVPQRSQVSRSGRVLPSPLLESHMETSQRKAAIQRPVQKMPSPKKKETQTTHPPLKKQSQTPHKDPFDSPLKHHLSAFNSLPMHSSSSTRLVRTKAEGM